MVRADLSEQQWFRSFALSFDNSLITQIKQTLKISDIIGNYVQIKHKSTGEFLGKCPFHNDKTPSFTVSDTKEFYHCFGCGVHGDIIKFIMEIENMNYVEAVKLLSSRAGLDFNKFVKITPKNHDSNKILYDINLAAAHYYHQMLQKPAASNANKYLHSRNLSQQTINDFQIGYAEFNANDLIEYLKRKFFNLSENDLVNSGLFVKNNNSFEGKSTTNNNSIIPRFRNRIMFPILDHTNKVIAFGGRSLGNGQPKYLNSAETAIFKKGNILYSSSEFHQSVRKKQQLIIVEGFMDVIALHQAGIKHIAAPLGTAITENQLNYMWKFVKEPIFCMDGDLAGRNSMIRLIKLALPSLKPGYSAKFTYLPKNSDPDDIINQYGVEYFNNLINKAEILSQVIWQNESIKHDINTPEGLASFQKELFNLAEQIKDLSTQKIYLNFYKNKIYALGSNNNAYNYSNNKANNKKTMQINRFNSTSDFASDDLQKNHIAELIFIITNYSELLLEENIFNQITKLKINNDLFNKLQAFIIKIYYNEGKELLNYSEKFIQRLHNSLNEMDYNKINLIFQKNFELNQPKAKNRLHLIIKFCILKDLRIEHANLHNNYVNNPTAKNQEMLFNLKKEIEFLN
ncbi:MAG: DNA primase, partial [Pseudomonadota bacterium]